MTRRIGIAAVFVLLVGSLGACSRLSPAAAVSAFYNAAAAGQTGQAVRMFALAGGTGPEAAMARRVAVAYAESAERSIRRHGGLRGVRIVAVHHADSSDAAVHVLLRFRDGSSETGVMAAARQRWLWRLRLY